MSDIVIIGAGIAGLSMAYMLNKEGYSVKIADKGSSYPSASFGNAGLVSPFEEPPLSRPGIIAETIKLMLKNQSPLIINSFSPELAKWLYLFAKNANQKRMKKTMILFEKYGQATMEFYEEIQEKFDIFFQKNGVAVVYTNEESFKVDSKALNNDPYREIWDYKKTKEQIPCVNDKIAGSIYLNRNAYLDPEKLMVSLKKYLKEKGVQFIENCEIKNFVFDKNRAIKAVGNEKELEGDIFIVCTGADTSLSKKIGTELILTPAKGYSITFKMNEDLKPKTAVLFKDQFLGFIPREKKVRITSKLEIGSYEEGYKMQRFQSILDTLKPFVVDFEMREKEYWSGFRPLTPNDIPLFGRDDSYHNIIHFNGMGWLGITFAPAIAGILTDIIKSDKANEENDDILLFSGFYQPC